MNLAHSQRLALRSPQMRAEHMLMTCSLMVKPKSVCAETELRIDPRKRGHTLLARIEAHAASHKEFSNQTIKKIPWYRQAFKTRSGLTVPFPIASQSDIPRAGWILAVGLMDSDQAPLALYRCPNEPSEPAFRQNGGTFRKAVKRCRDHILKNLSPQFPGNLPIRDALSALNHPTDEMTGSGMPYGVLGNRWSPTMKHLSFSQCQFVFKIFNNYTVLSDREKTKLEPILF